MLLVGSDIKFFSFVWGSVVGRKVDGLGGRR